MVEGREEALEQIGGRSLAELLAVAVEPASLVLHLGAGPHNFCGSLLAHLLQFLARGCEFARGQSEGRLQFGLTRGLRIVERSRWGDVVAC